MTPDTRKVDYVLVSNKAAPTRPARSCSQGASWAEVAKQYSLDHHPAPRRPSRQVHRHQRGRSRPTSRKPCSPTWAPAALARAIPVSDSLHEEQPAGQVQAGLLLPREAAVPATSFKPGKQQSFDEVKAQILQSLQQTEQQPQLCRSKIQALLAAQKKITRYAEGFKPPAPVEPVPADHLAVR